MTTPQIQPILLLALVLVPLLLVLGLPLTSAQLPFLPGTGNLTHLPLPQATTNNSNQTSAQPTSTANSIIPNGNICHDLGLYCKQPGDNQGIIPKSAIQSLINLTNHNLNQTIEQQTNGTQGLLTTK